MSSHENKWYRIKKKKNPLDYRNMPLEVSKVNIMSVEQKEKSDKK
jgi:hypothetical protein